MFSTRSVLKWHQQHLLPSRRTTVRTLNYSTASFSWDTLSARHRPIAAALRLLARDRCGVVVARGARAKKAGARPCLFTATAASQRLEQYGLCVSTQASGGRATRGSGRASRSGIVQSEHEVLLRRLLDGGVHEPLRIGLLPQRHEWHPPR